MAANLRKFLTPEIIFGEGARKLAGQYAKNLGSKKAMIVTDKIVRSQAFFSDVSESLISSGIDICIFQSVSPNPREIEVMEGAELFGSEKCDLIVSIGGGSPMDCAKGIGIVHSNQKHILEFKGVDKIEKPVPPLIFIPTTAGTASEVSQFSIILNQKEKVKIVIVSKAIVPDAALIDPEVTLTMDPYLTACTGIDAISHAFEAYVSKGSSLMTDLHAREAIKTLFEFLPKALDEPDNIEYRKLVLFGSLEAGLAFSNAILGAIHAMAHSLGGLLDLAHGECNGMLIEHVVDFNFSCAEEKYMDIMRILGIKTSGSSADNKKALTGFIREFKNRIGINRALRDRGVNNSDISELSRKAIADPCLITNPRPANKRDIEVIYEQAI